MDVETVIQAIKKFSPMEKRRVEAALQAANKNGPSEVTEPVSTSERVRRFDELMLKMPALPEPRVDASRESIYE